MNYNISSIPLFDKQAKRLAKKYPSLKKDLAGLIEKLSKEPKLGTAPGNNFYKLRLTISSKGKGKSGGARVIIYDKSE
jgi:mRNA-degrading endonuclease RelE of RelBE toxin-antitoxin system